MAQKIEIHCESCDAVFTVEHELDDQAYVPRACVFCSEPIEVDEANVFEYDEDEGDWKPTS